MIGQSEASSSLGNRATFGRRRYLTLRQTLQCKDGLDNYRLGLRAGAKVQELRSEKILGREMPALHVPGGRAFFLSVAGAEVVAHFEPRVSR